MDEVRTGTGGGAQGVLVTAVSVPAFGQAVRMVRRKGTVSLVGLLSGEFPTPIFDVVLKRITIRGSIVGTRQDLTEALAFASGGRVAAHINHARLEDVNVVFNALKAARVEGRMVLDIGLPTESREVAHREVTAMHERWHSGIAEMHVRRP